MEPKKINEIIAQKNFNFNDLVEILRYLRSENGCPWDRSQTHESIEINLIEEAYELVDAIESKSAAKMTEETGDVMLQAVFHSVIGEEKGEFTIDEVITAECVKLITRHTHIFGSDKAVCEKEALKYWEQNKYTEKNLISASERVRDIPKNLPALLLAEKSQKRAAKFNYQLTASEIEEQIGETLIELKKSSNKEETTLIELKKSSDKEETTLIELKSVSDKEEIGGKLLFLVVALLKEYGVESENALSKSTQKFIENFCAVDKKIKNDNKEISEVGKAELARYYNENKGN